MLLRYLVVFTLFCAGHSGFAVASDSQELLPVVRVHKIDGRTPGFFMSLWHKARPRVTGESHLIRKTFEKVYDAWWANRIWLKKEDLLTDFSDYGTRLDSTYRRMSALLIAPNFNQATLCIHALEVSL